MLHPTPETPRLLAAVKACVASHPGHMTGFERTITREVMVCEEFGLDYNRMLFVRWLVDTGKLTDFPSKEV